MIPHLTIASALEQAHGDRYEARDLIRASIVAEAKRQVEQEMRRADRSLVCARATAHAEDADEHGCRNDGSGCLCECHDAASPDYAYQKDATA